MGEPWSGVTDVYVAGVSAPTHCVDVSATLELGIASLREHAVYVAGLGRESEAAQFLQDIAGFGGAVAGCEYAATFQRFSVQ